jgi:putative tryptophan/tyrosine transport system substrate-binding protein
VKIWALVAAGLVAAAPAAAQSPPGAKLPRIGYVTTGSPAHPAQDPFRQGLREAGYIEGSNVLVEARYAKGRPDRVTELVAEVLQRDLDVLVVVSTQTALAAKKATTSVPTVFASVFDPVGAGIVASLGRPGGNITGIAMGMGGGFGGKWVELLKEAVPGVGHAAVLWNAANESSAKSTEEIRAAAGTLNVKLDLFDARNAAGLDKAFAAIAASRAQGLIVAPDPSFNANRSKLVQFAAKQRLPAVYFFKSFAEAGGLMAYGANNAASIRAAALYVDKILKGAKPGDLPVEQPTRFDLVINLKTATALGLNIPPSLLVRADEVIR